MENKIAPYHRGRQILQMLAEHAPISARGLEEIIEPKMHRRRVWDALNKLNKKGYLTKRYDGIFKNTGVYYQISQELVAREKVASFLKCTPESLELKFMPRHQELIHWEGCTIWTERFRKLFPDAQVTRDFKLFTNPLAMRLILADRDHPELMPDFLVVLPEKDERPRVSVAVEFERTLKSAERLRRKLNKYATETFLDGVIYICDVDSIGNKLRSIYSSKVMDNALRIKHYANNFVMFATNTHTAKGLAPVLVNAEAKFADLHEWMHWLRTTKMENRGRNSFKPLALTS